MRYVRLYPASIGANGAIGSYRHLDLMGTHVVAVVVVALTWLNICGQAAEPHPAVELNGLPTRCLCFSPDGGNLAVGGSEDKRALIHVIDTGDWKPRARLALRGTTVMAVAFSADSKLLFVAVDSKIIVVRIADVEELSLLSRHTDLVFALAVSSDGRYVATGGLDGRVGLWEAKELTHIKDLDRHADSIFALAFDRESEQLAAVGRSIFRIWPGIEKGRLEDIPFNDSGLSVCFSPQGDVVVAATVSGNLVAAKCAMATKAPRTFRLGPYMGGAAFVNGSDMLAVGVNRDLALFDLKQGKISKQLDHGESRIGTIQCDSLNERVAVGTWDGKVRIWSARQWSDGANVGQKR